MDVKITSPLLPLRDIVVFPSMVIPLFVGRDKSISALNEVMKKDKKDLPAGVPEENVYENPHILLYVFYAIAAASVVLLMVNQ